MKFDNNDKGFILIIGLVLILFVGVVALVFAQMISSGRWESAMDFKTLQTFYAAESAIEMSIKEKYDAVDLDGDGGVGSISNDGNPANDPALEGVGFFVTLTGGTPDTLIATARSSLTARTIEVIVN